MIKILVVDDEIMVREAIVALLTLNEDFQLVGQAGNGQQAIALAKELAPDVVLLDIQMPVLGGVPAVASIKALSLPIAILMLTTYDDTELIVEAMRNGASGYLLKDSDSTQVASAVRAVHQGCSVIGSALTPKLVANLSARENSQAVTAPLTGRELQVMMLLKAGMNNAEIGRQLGIESKTVRDHLVNIMSRLNLNGRTQAALWAQKNLS